MVQTDDQGACAPPSRIRHEVRTLWPERPAVEELEAMDETVRRALAQGGTIDITTKGRKTGEPRRIEIACWNVEGTVYITGMPGRPRSWYANLRANPAFTLHLKQGVTAELPAHATPILDREQRRAILSQIVKSVAERYGGSPDLDAWVEHSPLVSVAFDE